MVVLKISRKNIRIFFLTTIAVLLAFCGISYMQPGKPVSVYSAYIAGNYNSKAEIFNITEGSVIKTAKVNSAIRKEIEGYIKNITGMYVKVNAIPKEGYIIRVPLEPPLTVQSKWLKDTGKESLEVVFVFIPQQGRPYLMFLDSQARPLFYDFSSSIKKLLEQLEFHPEIIA